MKRLLIPFLALAVVGGGVWIVINNARCLGSHHIGN